MGDSWQGQDISLQDVPVAVKSQVTPVLIYGQQSLFEVKKSLKIPNE
jgi:hypothetical protein